MRIPVLVSLVFALGATPVVAAAQQPAPAARPEAASPDQRHPPRPELGFLLRHRAELGLEDHQISRLEQIAQRLERQNQPLLQRLRDAGIPVRRDRRDRVAEMTPEQRRELRQRLEAHKPTLLQMRENTRTAMEEARGVLTARQQERMRELMRRPDARIEKRRQGRDPRPARPHGQQPRPPRGT